MYGLAYGDERYAHIGKAPSFNFSSGNDYYEQHILLAAYDNG